MDAPDDSAAGAVLNNMRPPLSFQHSEPGIVSYHVFFEVTMRSISLDGEWQLFPVPPTHPPITHPRELGSSGIPPIRGTVPGNVELDLLHAGVIPDPFFGTNVLRLKDFELHNWWYSRNFATPEFQSGDRVVIRFEGVDTFATVWVNGNRAGSCDNMLIAHEFDITSLLRTGQDENELCVLLESPLTRAGSHRYEPSISGLPTNLEQAYVRKAPHMYGWDIMPRAVSAGLWRPVFLDVHRKPEIVDLFVRPYHVTADEAAIQFRWQIQAEPTTSECCTVRVRGRCVASEFSHQESCRFIAGDFSVVVKKPQLWWPRGYGDQALYDTVFELLLDGEVVDSRKLRVGIRTITLERTDVTLPDAPGEFVFRVNGERILVKGSNWVPVDAFHSRDAARIPRIMDHVADVGCNMLRCWGGNVYEDHGFFDLCDQLGVMVWQDFAMACGRYPLDDAFAAQLRREAEFIVRKLRNHPSLAIWAGDNECDEAYAGAGLDPNTNTLTRAVLPEVLKRLDPWRPYIPSSPYYSAESRKHGTVEVMPERHLWGPRDYYKSRFYTENRAHFVSEIGYHGCPSQSSLEKFLSPEALWPPEGNEEWRIHAADTTPSPGAYAYRIALMSRQVAEVFGQTPKTLDDFVVLSQIVQAEAKKYFVEMTRLRKWRKTGVLWWNLIDGWPQFSDAVMDYFYCPKLAYFYLRRVQQPVCVMVDEPEDWRCRVVLGNDSLERVQGTFRIWDAATGETIWEGCGTAERNANTVLTAIPASRGQQRLLLIEWETEGIKGGNHYLLGSPPFNGTWYRELLPAIAALPCGFDSLAVGK